MDLKTLDQINALFLIVFVILVSLALVRIATRYIAYKKEGLKIPALLPRDFFLFAGLALPFLGVLFFRALSLTPRGEDWYPFWVMGSGIAGIFGVAYWVWFEYFKIEKK